MKIESAEIVETPTPIRLADYTPPDFHIETVELSVVFGTDGTTVTSRMRMRRNPDGVADAPLRLDGVELELLAIAIDDTELTEAGFEVGAEHLTIPSVPDAFVLASTVRIHPDRNTALEGLYKSGDYYCTQCEAEGFRRITYYLDRPDVLARFTTRIEADRTTMPVLLSNGNLIDQGDLDGGRHFATWEDPHKKPCYLFALVAGNLLHIEDHFTTSEGRDVTLRIYTTEANIGKCDHAMASLKRAMKWDEEVFGLACDLDNYSIVVTDDFNMGAMENKGLNIFNSKFVLARPETATDGDYAGIEGVIGHEYFHNWTGNRVTCRDWFQLSLKEGLTVFRDQQFSGDMNSTAIQRIQDVRNLRTYQFAEDAGPMAHPVRPASVIEINNFYTVTVYEKGAEVVRMYYTLLGPAGFRRGMDLYFQRFDGQAVTCDDFRQAMADANDRNLDQFANWYNQAGTPTLAVTTIHDPAAETYTLHLRQSCPATPGLQNEKPFHLPIVVALLGRDGEELPLERGGETSRVLELETSEASFTFSGIAEAPVPSLLRGFSAPVKLDYDYTEDQLAFLVSHDRDPFSRWNASQSLLLRCMTSLISDHQEGRQLRLPDTILASFRAVLQQWSEDPALSAELLTLPSEAYLGDQMHVIDVDAVHEVRRFVRRSLAAALVDEFRAAYDTHQANGPYRFDSESVARRSLQGACLAYLMTLDDDAIHQLCLDQFRTADNMTEVVSALANLVHNGSQHAEVALEEFGRKWEADPLVMDKWFSIQATSPQLDTLQRVQRLLKHPAFSLRNPNKVRALVGAFCGSNRVVFHRLDGSGYRFLSDHVLALDQLNPHMASRLASVFNHWKRFDVARRDAMRAELQRIKQKPGLSRDVYEITTKALG